MKLRVKKKKLYYGDNIPVNNEDTNPLNSTEQTNQNNSFNQDGFKGTVNAVAGLGQTAGQFVSALGETKTGKVNTGAKVGGGILSGAATGASMGSIAGPWGTAIGAVVGGIAGGITSGIQAGNRNRLYEAQEKDRLDRERKERENYSRAVLNNYPTMGVKNALYFKNGGKMYAYGGQNTTTAGGVLQPVSSSESVAIGKNHEEGGIDIGVAEIENKEVVSNQGDGSANIFSDRIPYKDGKTFAQYAEELSTKKGKEEKNLSSSSQYARGTALRNIQKLDMELDRLFKLQESTKQRLGLVNPEGEAGFGDVVNGLMPYVDNITNAYLTMATPEIPKPVQNVAVPLKTTYNIEPQLADARSQMNQLSKNLSQNTSNSTTYRNNMIAASSGAISELNKLHGVKENTETELANTDKLNRQSILNANVAQENQYNLNKMNRIDDIHQRISANVADATMNYQQQQLEENMKRRDLLELEIVKQQYEDSGIWDMELQTLFDQYQKGDMRYEEFAKKLSELKTKKQKPEETQSKGDSKGKYIRKFAPKTSSYLGLTNSPTIPYVSGSNMYAPLNR